MRGGTRTGQGADSEKAIVAVLMNDPVRSVTTASTRAYIGQAPAPEQCGDSRSLLVLFFFFGKHFWHWFIYTQFHSILLTQRRTTLSPDRQQQHNSKPTPPEPMTFNAFLATRDTGHNGNIIVTTTTTTTPS